MHLKGYKSETANKNPLFIIYRIHPNSVTLNQLYTHVGFILSLSVIVKKHKKASQCSDHFLETLHLPGADYVSVIGSYCLSSPPVKWG